MGSAYYQSFAQQQVEALKDRGIELKPALIKEMLAELRPFDLSCQLEKLGRRPLFIWHGKQDVVVPYSFSEKLYDTIRGHYEQEPKKLKFYTDEKAEHKVSRMAILQSVEWFEEHLLSSKEHVSQSLGKR